MKIQQKFLSLFLVISVLCLTAFVNGADFSVHAAQIGYVNATDVRIRSEASTSSDILATVSNVTVTVDGSKKGIDPSDSHTWYLVTYGNITGYIRDDLITVQTVLTDQSFEAQISAFPASYANSLRALHAIYPNWNFVADVLPLTLDDAVNLESTRKLVSNSSAISWLSMGLGAYEWGTGKYVPHDTNWYVASREVIRYYLDPRNFLNQSDIYMYMQLGYNPATQTEAGLQTIIQNTFLSNSFSSNDPVYGGSYAKVIMAAAQQSQVSPYVLAATIIQEQGKNGTSPLISGTYSGYEGYYNYFNVQASGNTTSEKYQNGLNYAKNHGWSSIPAAIIGGAEFCANGYITQGQDTYFKMNFNIQDPDRIWHEYAGAVHNALASGRKIAGNYSSLNDASLTFYIPVYQNMSDTVSALPAQTNQSNNYYFLSMWTEGLTPSFTQFGYSYELYVTGNQAISVSLPAGASYASDTYFPLNTGQNRVVLSVRSESGYTTDYVLSVKASQACALYVDYGQGVSVPASNSSGFMLGDVNGDSRISLIDLTSVQRHLLKKSLLSGNALKAADINLDNKVTLIDLTSIQRHLLGKSKIS